MISFNKQFVFFHNPKTGGTSVYEALKEYGNYLKGKHQNKHLVWNDPKLEIVKSEITKKGGNYDDYIKFGAIRNPYDRVISYSFWRYKNGSYDNLVLSCSNLYPQHCYIDDAKWLDHVIRFETLQKDFDLLCDKIDVPRRQLPFALKSSNKKDSIQYLNRDIVNRINNVYRKDFENLRYNML